MTVRRPMKRSWRGALPCVVLAGLEASAPIKAEHALKQLGLDVGGS